MDARADIGLIGLGVMGRNLALNIADHGYTVAVHNRSPDKVRDFIAHCVAQEPSSERVIGCTDLAQFVEAIKRPRVVVLLVKGGEPTEATINSLMPHLECGDMIVDCGNAHWRDTVHREQALAAQGVEFIGCGISGGEIGSRFGPSLMAGGSAKAWARLEPIWLDIAAKVDPATGQPLRGAVPGKPVRGGTSCTAYLGPNGAGHYVKMVHNGIEYIDMQLIAEAYWLLKNLLNLEAGALADIFRQWNGGVLSSYLIDITADILQQKDPTGAGYFIDHVLDAAEQKGMGQWAAASALEVGVPANVIAEAVYTRSLSALKDERQTAAKLLDGPQCQPHADRAALVNAVHDALYCAKISAYAQGFQLMAKAQDSYGWTLDFATIANIWRDGCIIRACFLHEIADAYGQNPGLKNLMLAPAFNNWLKTGQDHWRQTVALAVSNGIAVPALSSALAYFDGYRSPTLPANLIQAQRDYFGAHTYERIDRPRGQFFHLEWSAASRTESEL